MERLAKRKSWRTLVFALGIVFLIGGGIFIACQKEANVEVSEPEQPCEGVEYPIPENAVFSIDNIHLIKKASNVPWEPWFDTKGQGDPVSFGGTNRYYLPYNIKNYAQYRKLLEGDGKSKYNILRYVIGTYNPEVGAYPIIRVELPKPADREWFERSYEPIQTSAARTRSAVTMTLARARQFFAQFKNLSCATTLQCPCIPFQYAGDGCYARARYMRKLKAWKEYPIPENAVVFTTNVRILQPGELGWFDTEGTGIPIYFGETFAYYLPRDIKDYEEYYQLLKGNPSEEYIIS